MIMEEIIKLEKRVRNYESDYKLAVKSTNKNRQRKYQTSIKETKEQIKTLERSLTIDDIKGLREKAIQLNKTIAKL